MSPRLKPALAVLSLLLPLTSPLAAPAPVPLPPVAARRPVVDTSHGVKVEAPHQWLESSDDPAHDQLRTSLDGAHVLALMGNGD